MNHSRSISASGVIQKNRDAVGLHDNLRNCRWVASPPLLCFQHPQSDWLPPREACNSRQEKNRASLIIIVGPYEADVPRTPQS